MRKMRKIWAITPFKVIQGRGGRYQSIIGNCLDSTAIRHAYLLDQKKNTECVIYAINKLYP